MSPKVLWLGSWRIYDFNSLFFRFRLSVESDMRSSRYSPSPTCLVARQEYSSGIMTGMSSNRRSFIIKTGSGLEKWDNRYFCIQTYIILVSYTNYGISKTITFCYVIYAPFCIVQIVLWKFFLSGRMFYV